jgi:glucosamine--fructose-6-phosphate aminotransferase (isomerizing)
VPVEDFHMWSEIHAQPEVAALNIQDHDKRISSAAAWLAALEPRRVDFVGCGDSRFAGLVGRYATSRWADLPSTSSQSFDALAYLLGEMRDSVLVAISNSGESQKTVDCARAAAEKGIPVLAVTRVPDSRLAQASDKVLMTILPDAPVAASHTTSHVASLASTLALALGVAEHASADTRRIRAALESAPSAMRETLIRVDASTQELAERHKDRSRWVLLGAGPHRSTALAGAAKLYETSYIPAICEELEEYAHEQMFVLQPKDPVLVVTSRGASQQRAVEIADGVSDLNGDVVIISELDGEVLHGHQTLRVPRLVEPIEEVTSLTHLLPLQLYAFHLALARGQDPDRVRYFDVNMRLIGQGKTTQDIDQ